MGANLFIYVRDLLLLATLRNRNELNIQEDALVVQGGGTWYRLC